MDGRSRIRDKVRARDGHRCFFCGRSRGAKKDLDVHHMDKNLEGTRSGKKIDNPMHRMITLCHKCHYGFHKNWNGTDYNAYFKALIHEKLSTSPQPVQIQH